MRYEKNPKSQTPISREIPNPKLQPVRSKTCLEFDCWSFFGVWCLYRGSLLSRSLSRKDSPWPRNFSSNFCVQLQSQHAQGSVPFSCRKLRRECASCTLTSSKYSSQYGRSSANGGSQKQVSTQVATPSLFTRASFIL